MKTKRLTSLFLSFLMILSLMVPAAFAAAGGLQAAYDKTTGTVNVTAKELSQDTGYSRVSVRSDKQVLGIGSGTMDASGVLTARVPVGPLDKGNYEVHIFKDSDGTVAAMGTFTVAGDEPGPGPGPGPGPVEPEKIPDGNYYVDVALWHETKDQKSMGDKAFENNRRALVTVKNGEVTKVQVATNPVNMSGIISAIVEAKVDGKKVTVIKTAPITTQPAGHDYDYLQSFSFAMPQKGKPEKLSGVTYVPISFKVPDTPMDAVAANGCMDARLRFDWSAASKTSDTTINGSGEIGHGVNPETGEGIVDVDLLHKPTGIKLHTDSQAIDKAAKLDVTAITEGAGFDAAVKAMKGIEGWTLYNIVTTVKDVVTAPEGQVKLFVPCTDKGLTVYRINDNGTKVPIKGEVKDGYYVFNTSKLGLFAVVGPLGEAVLPVENQFPDVKGHWAAEDIGFIVERGLFNGLSEHTFAPDMSMTRGMFVTVLARLNGVDLSKQADSQFTDVAKDAWYAKPVAWAAANGVVKGVSADAFNPDAIITRQDMAVILARYAEKFNITLNKVKDVTFADENLIADYAKDAVNAMASAGLINGVGGNMFSPLAESTRAQVAALLARFIRSYSL